MTVEDFVVTRATASCAYAITNPYCFLSRILPLMNENLCINLSRKCNMMKNPSQSSFRHKNNKFILFVMDVVPSNGILPMESHYIFLVAKTVNLKEYYEIVGESRPLSAFSPKHADFFTEMNF